MKKTKTKPQETEKSPFEYSRNVFSFTRMDGNNIITGRQIWKRWFLIITIIMVYYIVRTTAPGPYSQLRTYVIFSGAVITVLLHYCFHDFGKQQFSIILYGNTIYFIIIYVFKACIYPFPSVFYYALPIQNGSGQLYIILYGLLYQQTIWVRRNIQIWVQIETGVSHPFGTR